MARRRSVSQMVFEFAVRQEICSRCGGVRPRRGECGGCLTLSRSEGEIRSFLKLNPDPHCNKEIVRALAQCDTSREAEAICDKWIADCMKRIKDGWSEEVHRERHWTSGKTTDLACEPIAAAE